MDLNILVAAGVFTLIALLTVRYAIKLAGLFLLAGLIMFLIGLHTGNASSETRPAESQVGKFDTSNIIMPDVARIGYPPRIKQLK
jgi:uncharacterized membrane protein YciS (DUF1049 family)